ncbi:hypothetical protein KC332_g16562 [Hortaea werneckii]|uniref:Uncharacterized protein n=1 Tax=Hortaea werneckii TaxID=91943 RepID=A0A3M7I8S3_HORWE|nr:hypothetical protein KC350_g17414 [Hortaea werneckii]KAI6805177.1 hypothetical protein KC358_g14451 [Hortaea werneckii]KAI6898182.1 hypothetical protein KC348_g17523 [Hortaea werneckii]KAI6923229.1 hypothetical protein KC341_g14874 [Hortaea werneckii]KAI6957741.1 hypothetical protein KC321_g14414 [Hortaea werneckii]
MAFRQPQQRPQPLRQPSLSRQTGDVQAPVSPAHKRTVEDSQEWILFSPQYADGRSQTTTTSQTPRTATATDLGSLETHIRSQPADSAEEATCQGTEVDDENEELDSLDDGLHAFQHNPFSASSNHQLDQSGGTVLPTHDGLGAFSSGGLQEQLWQFERYNPHRRRHARRRSSIQQRLDEVEEESEHDLIDERTARIEKWRLEQSKAVLEEIEKETRRRRRRMSRMSAMSGAISNAAPIVTDDTCNEPVAGEHPALPKSQEQVPQRTDSWWQRITKRVIQDLIGLDENTLSVIFGEQLPEDPSPTPTPQSPISSFAARHESRVTFRDNEYHWETRFLERIARELGVLIHQLAEHDGRAFSTYQSILEVPEYAGLPPMYEQQAQQQKQPSLRSQRRRKSAEPGPESAPSDALFTPTLPQTTASPGGEPDTSLWGIEEEPADQDVSALQERAYWERDIDVNMIFSYLRRRFSSNNPASQPEPTGPLPASWATANSASASATAALGTSPESFRRAELIRQQHPLVSRAATATASASADRATTTSPSIRRDSLLRRHQQMQQLHHKRGAAGISSCASQSTKRSRRSRSTSSRNYWDLGGSVGSLGSAGGGAGPGRSSGLGGWGEV